MWRFGTSYFGNSTLGISFAHNRSCLATHYFHYHRALMWIVRLALRRPYTFVVVALLIAVLGAVSIVTMPTDIFPNINIPVVSVIWSYGGLSPTEMQDRIGTVVERAMTTTVSNIEHVESQSLRGITVIKVYFQPGADVNSAVAEVTAVNQTLIKILPPGITPP